MSHNLSRLFVPMERPSSIRFPKPGDVKSRQLPIKETVVDANFIYDVEALGHIMFQCPAVIEAYVERWMAFDQGHEESGLESIKQLLSMVISHRPVLQITARPITNPFGKHDGYENNITFLCNFRHATDSHDYEVSDKHLLQHASEDADELPELFMIRLKMLMTGIMSHNNGESFTRRRINASQTAAIFGGFKYDTILGSIQDRSAYTVALVCFLLRYCITMMPKSQEDEEVSMDESTLEARSQQESAFEIFQVLDTFMKNLRANYGSVFIATDELPPHLCVYKETTHDADKFIFGIPIEVLTSELSTLLWLEWVWFNDAWRTLKLKGDSATVRGLSRMMDDLWRAKALLLSSNYSDFFELWDKDRLMPFIERMEEAK